MAGHRVRDKADFDAVVLEGMEKFVGLTHRNPLIAGVGKDERGRSDLVGVRHGGLSPVVHGVVVEPG